MGTIHIGIVLLLALSCKGLRVRTRCRSGASCVHSQNGSGDLDIEQKCQGAYCGVIYGNGRSRQRNNQRNNQRNRGANRQQQNRNRGYQNNRNYDLNQNGYNQQSYGYNGQRYVENYASGAGDTSVIDCYGGSCTHYYRNQGNGFY